MNKENIKKAFDLFVDDKFTEAKEILKEELHLAKEEYFSKKLGLNETGFDFIGFPIPKEVKHLKPKEIIDYVRKWTEMQDLYDFNPDSVSIDHGHIFLDPAGYGDDYDADDVRISKSVLNKVKKSFTDYFKNKKYLSEGLYESVFEEVGKYKGSSFKLDKSISFDKMKVGEVYGLTYTNSGNRRVIIFRFDGFSDNKEKYGDSGVKFKTWNEIKNEYDVKTLKELEDLEDKNEHGHSTYIIISEDGLEKEPAIYLYKTRWSIGSSANKVSFFEVEKQ